MNLINILDQARQSERGISITAPDLTSYQLRRRFYNFRERLRREGVEDYDRLSFVVSDADDLKIVQRQPMSQEELYVAVNIRALSPSESNIAIHSRGKSKFGVSVPQF